MKMYAAIYIGTYEISLKVYEVTKEKCLKEIDCLRTKTEIAKDLYQYNRLSKETIEHLLKTLTSMKETIEMYQVNHYQAFASYSIKPATNILFVLDRIYHSLDLNINILSNSEQRFLSYQALAVGERFNSIVKNSALIVDIGGYSLQLTLFDKGKLLTTQHILIGAINVREYLKKLFQKADYKEQIFEMIEKEMEVFSNMYLKNISLDYIILLNDQVFQMLRKYIVKNDGSELDFDTYLTYINKMTMENFHTVIPDSEDVEDQEEIFTPMLLLLQAISNCLISRKIYFPDVSVNDGIVYDVAKETSSLALTHNFEDDIISASWMIAKRYGSYEPHLVMLEKLSMQMCDTLKKRSGLTKREQLLLRVAAILHDCGKYISLAAAGQCSYEIIVSSEILGLTHKEREMIAYVARFNRGKILPFIDLAARFSKEEYVTILKLLAILRVANALDRSHKQKFQNVKMSLKNNELIIKISSEDSISLEKGLFETKADYFEEIFMIRPVICEKK